VRLIRKRKRNRKCVSWRLFAGEVTKSDLGEKASTFSKAFREEMTKEWRQQQQQSQRVKK